MSDQHCTETTAASSDTIVELAEHASSTARVLDAVRDLHASHKRATREAVQRMTGLVMHVVDERLRVLTNAGRLRRIGRGEYEPLETWPEPRPITKTLLPGGLVKLEIGDVIVTLTPAEDRMLSSLQGGALLQLSAIETTRQSDALYSVVLAHMQRLERRAVLREERVGGEGGSMAAQAIERAAKKIPK